MEVCSDAFFCLRSFRSPIAVPGSILPRFCVLDPKKIMVPRNEAIKARIHPSGVRATSILGTAEDN